jgi:hypothetical protein
MRPSSESKNNEIKKLGSWLYTQNKNYKNNKEIMKDKNIREMYENFIKEYKEYFISNEELWKNNLNLVKNYIDENKMRPSSESKNIEIKKLGSWLGHQNQNYKNNKEIMKEKNIREIYENFLQDYKEYFI